MPVAKEYSLRPGDSIYDNGGKQFTVSSLLGKGSFGNVYLVKGASDQSYAIKILNLYQEDPPLYDEYLKRFEIEFQSGSINHPNLVRSISKGEVNGNPFIVMEFCNSGDLRSNMGTIKNNFSVLRGLLSGILDGLEVLHKNGNVHRDLKPENILLTRSMIPKLADYGLAADLNNRQTRKGFMGRVTTFFGTPYYTPPEQFNDYKKFSSTTSKTDIYAFGTMLYEIISSKPAFHFGDNVQNFAELQKVKLDNVYFPLSQQNISGFNQEVLQKLDALIFSCITSDYDKRIGSTRVIKNEINKVLLNGNVDQSQVEDEDNAIQDPIFFSNLKLGKVFMQVMKGEELDKIVCMNSFIHPDRDSYITLGATFPNDDDPQGNSISFFESLTSFISKYHATIIAHKSSDRCIIIDGQWRNKDGKYNMYPSLNGTFVNAERVPKEGIVLRSGDIVMMGNLTVKVFQSNHY